jgi:hypothetical protein
VETAETSKVVVPQCFVVACPCTQVASNAPADGRPVKIKDSSNRQYVARIPSDVVDKARGQTVTVEIDGRQVSFRIGQPLKVVKFSLRTRNQTLARSRHRAVAEHMSNWFDILRTGVTTLTHCQTIALAGELYRT